jgi:hypothetical protein
MKLKKTAVITTNEAMDFNDDAVVAFAAWHVAHNDSHIAFFAPEAHA